MQEQRSTADYGGSRDESEEAMRRTGRFPERRHR